MKPPVVTSDEAYSKGYTIDRTQYEKLTNDLLIGGSADDAIYGGCGNDYIHGNVGKDVIEPGPGKDIVHSGLACETGGSGYFDVVKSTFSGWRYPVGTCGAALFCAAAAFGSERFPSGGSLMTVNDPAAAIQVGDCKSRFAALVKELDEILASDPKSVTSVYEIFYKYFPVEKCTIEDVLTIARASRFFIGSDDGVAYYNVRFNNASVSSGYGFFVQISVAKKTGNLELPFAKVNGY